MTDLGDTHPTRPVRVPPPETPPPPRLLMGLVVGVLVLGVVGVVLGVYAYRNERVPPRYMSVLESRLPMLSALRPQQTRAPLPTPMPQADAPSLDELLGITVDVPTATPADDDITPTLASVSEPVTVAQVSAPTATSLAAPTVAPTPTPTDIPAPTEAPAVAAVQDAPPQAANAPDGDVQALVNAVNLPRPPVNARNFGFTHTVQTWNNCGPANVTMALSYFGWRENQAYAQQYLRGGSEDRNVSPHEIVRFVNEQTQVRALSRLGGDMTLLKRLVAAQFPVIIEVGYTPEGNDWLGHYQTVVGYDDLTGMAYMFDSWLGAGPEGTGLPVNYAEVDREWRMFNRVFVVLYEPGREGELALLLGDHATPEGAAQRALEAAQSEARENPQDAFALMNMGESLLRLGQAAQAAAAFDQARQRTLPYRIWWYRHAALEAYYEDGRYNDVIALADAVAVNLGGGTVEELFYWKGRALHAQGRTAEARSAYQRALSQNSRFGAARAALSSLSS